MTYITWKERQTNGSMFETAVSQGVLKKYLKNTKRGSPATDSDAILCHKRKTFSNCIRDVSASLNFVSLMKNSEGHSADKIPMSTCDANSAE